MISMQVEENILLNANANTVLTKFDQNIKKMNNACFSLE